MDQNGDGDARDYVLNIYDMSGGLPGVSTPVPMAIAPTSRFTQGLAVAPTFVAYRASEAGQGHTDLNGDGDTSDTVVGYVAHCEPLAAGCDAGMQPPQRPCLRVNALSRWVAAHSAPLGACQLLHEPARVTLRFGAGAAAEHARELADALFGLQRPRGGGGAAVTDAFFDREVMICQGGDLRQMRDAEHLSALTKGV